MAAQEPEAAARPVFAPAPPRTTLVGRDADLGEVFAALDEARLLTMTGTGATGKTRLAAASRLRAESALLVLDNCEQLLSAVADVVDVLLDRCPERQVLATSREPLGVSRDRIWPVPPLALPPAGADVALPDVAAARAAQLFAQRVRMIDVEFGSRKGTPERRATLSATCWAAAGDRARRPRLAKNGTG
jgi:predicted ATPase